MTPEHGARLDPRVIEHFPHYSVMVIHARNLENGPSDERSVGLLCAADRDARCGRARWLRRCARQRRAGMASPPCAASPVEGVEGIRGDRGARPCW